MSELIKPSLEGSRRMEQNAARIDRMKMLESEKSSRNRDLFCLKASTLPVVLPALPWPIDSKCGVCNVEKEEFTKLHDWFEAPFDVLALPFPSKQGWFEWFSSWLHNSTLSSSITSIAVHPAHIKMIRKLQNKRSERPLVFALKSDNLKIDLILVHFVLYQNGIKLPLMLYDGDLQEFPTMTTFNVMKSSEASESQVASHLRSNGSTLVVLDNKGNKDLKNVLSASGFGLVANVYLVPVSINSEKLRPGFVLGKSKEKLGIVKINFHEPYTVKDLDKKELAKDLDLDDVKSKSLIQRISKHINNDIAMKLPIMSTNIVAFLLLTRYREGTTNETLVCELNKMREDLIHVDFAFEGESEDIIDHAVGLLGKNLVTNGNEVKANIANILELASYAEPLLIHFALESILVVSARSMKHHQKYIDYNALISTASELCQMLQFEIPFKKPCVDFESALVRAFDRCSLKEILRKPAAKILTESETRAVRMARYVEESDSEDSNDDGYQSRNPDNEVTINEDLKDQVEWLENVTLPILDTYLTVIYSFKSVDKKSGISKKSFEEVAMKAMREELEDGNCKYWESCSAKWMRSCIDYLKSEKFVVESVEGKLSYSSKKSIKSLIYKLEKFFVKS